MMYICTSLKALPSGSGYSSWDVEIFPCNFSTVQFLLSAHKVPDDTLHGLLSSEAASEELCLGAEGGSVSRSALWRIEDSGKRQCGF